MGDFGNFLVVRDFQKCSSERLIPNFGNQEILGTRFAFRNKVISALNFARIAGLPVFGGPATAQPQVLTLDYSRSIEASLSCTNVGGCSQFFAFSSRYNRGNVFVGPVTANVTSNEVLAPYHADNIKLRIVS